MNGLENSKMTQLDSSIPSIWRMQSILSPRLRDGSFGTQRRFDDILGKIALLAATSLADSSLRRRYRRWRYDRARVHRQKRNEQATTLFPKKEIQR